mgnify:CR=1 FL=1|tara:strand:+ start:5251 stop:7026 length:1776 start_codon:yes stop_codon:yes gene_type:complete
MQTKKTPTKSQLTPPQGVRNACKTGIKLFEEGLGGSGLESATIREARGIVRGTPITIAKAKKMVRWWGRNARFLTFDKDSPAWVAAMLWGGRAGLSWSKKLKRTFDAKEESIESNQSRTTTSHSSTMSMENAIVIEDQSKFDSIDLKERSVEIHMKVTSPFQLEEKAENDTSTDVKIRGPVYVGSDEMLDRHDELVTTEAIMSAWKSYSKNPVILYNHSKTYGVIGTMMEVKLGTFNGVKVPIGTAVIDGGEKDITRKINKGFLKAFSIGFIAKAAVKECKEDESCYMKFTEIDWVETSIVDVPASPNALFSVQKSFVWGNTSTVGVNNSSCGCGCGAEDLCGSSETSKHILAVEEDDETYTITYEKLPMDEMSYGDDEEDKKSHENRLEDIENAISKLSHVILGNEKDSDSVNNHILEGVRIMDNADTTPAEEVEIKSLEEELVSDVIETPVLIEEKELDLPVEEKEIEMPTPKEALLDIASSLKAITEKLFEEEVVEEVAEDELTLVKAELAQLKANIAEQEAKDAMEAEIQARVKAELESKGIKTPSRKSIATSVNTEPIDAVKTKNADDVNGLGNWLEAHLKAARRY